MQLENDGNFEGEAAGNPGDSVAHRRLPGDLRRRAQLPGWAAWTTSSATRSGCGRTTASTCARFGRLDVAPLYRYNSPRTYSLAAASVPLTAQQIAANPGYVRLPAGQPVFFGLRGSQEFEDFALVRSRA